MRNPSTEQTCSIYLLYKEIKRATLTEQKPQGVRKVEEEYSEQQVLIHSSVYEASSE